MNRFIAFSALLAVVAAEADPWLLYGYCHKPVITSVGALTTYSNGHLHQPTPQPFKLLPPATLLLRPVFTLLMDMDLDIHTFIPLVNVRLKLIHGMDIMDMDMPQ